MGAFKSPGPDGILACFFQKCWPLVKKEVTKVVLSILNSGRVLRELNRTFITLIPKTDNPEGVSDYRPISPCNVFMRIVSKCITNRVARVMGALVSEEQNAFIPGRHISDNILLAHETIHRILSHKKGKHGRCAFKADMSKAYDRIKWDFLEAVLIRFGFPQKLVLLIMNCVTTVYYEVLLNGSPLPRFQPRCGLRQGDPLSSFLFILCMEVLGGQVETAKEVGLLKGITLCQQEKPITHLFFADDSVFFFQDSRQAAANLKRIMDDYCDASSHKLNLDKSGILFSPSTTLAKAQETMSVLRIRSTKGIGKLTLISSVLSNLSNYFLSVFKIPVSVSSKLNSLLAQFWWAGCKLGKKLHWCSKNFLSLPKSLAGLGIWNVGCLNKALLAKHGWRLVSGDDSYFSRIFRRKIFGTNTFVDGIRPKQGAGCSWGVKSISYGLELIMENIGGWKPSLESGLNAWNAKWVNGATPEPQDRLLDPAFLFMGSLQVQELWNSDLTWNAPLVRALFKEQDAEWIIATTLCTSRKQDEVFWPLTNDGVYSVKSGYGIAFMEFFEKKGTIKDKSKITMTGRGFCKSCLWSLLGPNLWKILIWKIITNTLLVGFDFQKRSIEGSHTCRMCLGDQPYSETIEHIFRDCGLSSRVWAGSVLGIRVEGVTMVPLSDWIINWLRYLEKLEDGERRVLVFLATLWGLWTTRNNAVFKGGRVMPGVLLQSVANNVEVYFQSMLKEKEHSEKVQGQVMLPIGGNEMRTIKDGFPVYMVGGRDQCRRIRVKVDAGWSKNLAAGIGWVAYDGEGVRFEHGSRKITAESALHAKVLGIAAVIQWAAGKGFLHLEVVSDCLPLIYQIAGYAGVNHGVKDILQDLKGLYACFHCYKFFLHCKEP
ncbi:uncharacterized protein LOC141629427 [Silene latifolia]|uniref:uncharacterized protein LOC141629427 n=1 Tax=Silene latifolia TaxID=37657 RepID=UPI003D76B61F